MERFGVTDDSLSEDDTKASRKKWLPKLLRPDDLQEEVRVSLHTPEDLSVEQKPSLLQRFIGTETAKEDQEPVWQPHNEQVAPVWTQPEARPAFPPVTVPEATSRSVENRSLRLRLAGDVLTEWALKGYLAEKKARSSQVDGRYESPLTSQLSQQSEALARQQIDRPPQPFAPIAEKPLTPPIDEQLLGAPDDHALEIGQQQHVEQSAWHSIVVDEHGREVHGAINYGEAYQREHQKEQAPLVSSTQDDSALGGVDMQYAVGGSSLPDPSTVLPSGQVPDDHTLPLGVPGQQQDPAHLLEPPHQGKILDILKSPNLWLALLIIVLAYFIATLI